MARATCLKDILNEATKYETHKHGQCFLTFDGHYDEAMITEVIMKAAQSEKATEAFSKDSIILNVFRDFKSKELKGYGYFYLQGDYADMVTNLLLGMMPSGDFYYAEVKPEDLTRIMMISMPKEGTEKKKFEVRAPYFKLPKDLKIEVGSISVYDDQVSNNVLVSMAKKNSTHPSLSASEKATFEKSFSKFSKVKGYPHFTYTSKMISIEYAKDTFDAAIAKSFNMFYNVCRDKVFNFTPLLLSV